MVIYSVMKCFKIPIFLLLIFCNFNCRPDIPALKSVTFRGIVIEKYKEGTGCYGAIVIRQNKQVDTLKNQCYCGSAKSDVWDFVILNDSIYKEKGSSTVNVIRKRNIKKFDYYPICYQ